MRLVSVYRESRAKRILYDLLKERSTEDDPYVNISHRELPTWRQHCRFVVSIPYRAWLLIKNDKGEYVGQISATKKNEIGITILQAHRGKGYGKQAVKLLTMRYRPLPAIQSERSGSWLANINPANTRSIVLFTGAGFRMISNTYAL